MDGRVKDISKEVVIFVERVCRDSIEEWGERDRDILEKEVSSN